MCNCMKISKEKASYDNIKKIAKLYANSENKEVFIYKVNDAFYFSSVEENKERIKNAIEFILPNF